MMLSGRTLRTVAALLPVAVFLAVYIPRVGHGFILDDYRWISESRTATLSDILGLFAQNNGFYRPLVSLTFALDYAFFGLEPLWYGFTNAGLALTCAVLIYILARAFNLPWGAATLAGSLWLLNFHGISMAVLWISGRTALLLTAAAIAAGACVVRRRLLPAAVLTAVALLSKEEAVALPLILGVWIHVLNRDDPARRRRMLLVWSLCSVVLLAAYFALRTYSGAMTPATAPHYYRFTFDPVQIGRNMLEYADRTFTLPILVVGISWLLLRRKQGSETAVAPRIDLIACAGVWILGAYALTVFLPVRSSLYSCFPLVGACLIAAELCRAFWLSASEQSKVTALRAAVVLAVIAAPIHYSRTHRLVHQAEVSHSIWNTLASLTRDVPEGATVAIHDDMTRRANVRSAFGGLAAPAYELLTGRRLNFWLEPPVDDAELRPVQPVWPDDWRSGTVLLSFRCRINNDDASADEANQTPAANRSLERMRQGSTQNSIE
jgi:hypothetical protein